MTPSAAGEGPALTSTGKLVAREDERIGSTIPMPTFARRPPTMSSFALVDIPHSFMVGQQRYRNFNFDKFPTPSSFLPWKIRFRNQVPSCSDFPSEAISWKVCTNWRHESLSSSRQYWNCTTWKFIRRYRRLKTMVKRSIDQKLRLRNFDAKHRNIESGAVVKSHRGLSGIERGQGICYQWKDNGQCSIGDYCSFLHESNDRANPTPKAAPHSEPQSSKTRGENVSRKRNAIGRSLSGKFNLPPCKYFLNSTCTKSPCEYWHPPECQFP